MSRSKGRGRMSFANTRRFVEEHGFDPTPLETARIAQALDWGEKTRKARPQPSLPRVRWMERPELPA